jgi:murein DD-endopeptidase MepM/ murein hydrolase activator NlpD
MNIFKKNKINIVWISGLLFVLFTLKIRELNKQISGIQNQITDTRKQQATLSNELKIYDSQIRSTELQVEAKETQIEDAGLQIDEIQNQIDRRSSEIADNKQLLASLLIELHQLDGNSFLQMTFGKQNFSDFLDDLQYTTSVESKIFDLVQNIKVVKQKLENQQSTLEVQLKKLEDIKNELEASRGSLIGQQSQKQQLLDKTKGIERNYQKLLTVSKAEEANLEKESQDLDASIRAKLGNRTILPSKGVFAWPMDGKLTQGYGNTGFTALGYNFHNGIDIAAPAGRAIYAVAKGTVVACDTGEASYGNWCAIKHTVDTKSGSKQLISLYGHMRTFVLKVGQNVEQGDIIGYEGNTGNTTRLLYGPERGYHCTSPSSMQKVLTFKLVSSRASTDTTQSRMDTPTTL